MAKKSVRLIAKQWSGTASISTAAADSLKLSGQTGQIVLRPPELRAHSWQGPAISDWDKSVRVDWDRDLLSIHPADSLTLRKPSNSSFISLSRWVNFTHEAQACDKYGQVIWPAVKLNLKVKHPWGKAPNAQKSVQFENNLVILIMYCFWSMFRVSASVVVSSRCSVMCWLVCLMRSSSWNLFLEVAVSLRSVCVYIYS